MVFAMTYILRQIKKLQMCEERSKYLNKYIPLISHIRNVFLEMKFLHMFSHAYISVAIACEWSVYRDVISVTNVYIYLNEVIVMKCSNYNYNV